MDRLVCDLMRLEVANCVLCEVSTASCKGFDDRNGVLSTGDGIAGWVSGLHGFLQPDDDLRDDLCKFVHGDGMVFVLLGVCCTDIKSREHGSYSLASVVKVKEVGGTSDLKYLMRGLLSDQARLRSRVVNTDVLSRHCSAREDASPHAKSPKEFNEAQLGIGVSEL